MQGEVSMLERIERLSFFLDSGNNMYSEVHRRAICTSLNQQKIAFRCGDFSRAKKRGWGFASHAEDTTSRMIPTRE